MKNLSRVILVFVLLLLVTSIATAKGPDLEPFSTTGYTTNLVQNPDYVPPPSPTNPPVLPSEFVPLPGDYTKFHISAQGGPEWDTGEDGNDVCSGLYGIPCETLCDLLDGTTGVPPSPLCGTDGFFPGGSFIFEEWGLYYPLPAFTDQGFVAGPNHGLLNVETDNGGADMRFGGLALYTSFDPLVLDVAGSFQVLDGEGDYKGLKGEGTYTGDADFVFTVGYDFTSCKGDDCPDRCAVFGTDYKIKKDGVETKDIKLKKDKLEWEIKNGGESVLTVSNISLWWPAVTTLDKVKYGSKTVFQGMDSSGYINIDLTNWGGKPKDLELKIDLTNWGGKPKDLELKANKKKKLKFEFDDKGISQEPSDYTILVEFDNGCAVTFVAF